MTPNLGGTCCCLFLGILFVVLKYVTADCSRLSQTGLASSYWHYYASGDEVVIMTISESGTTVTNQATGEVVEEYTCMDMLIKTPYVMQLVSDVTNSSLQYCIEMIAADNVVLSKFISVSSLSVAGACEDEFNADTSDFRVNIQYDTSSSSFTTSSGSCPRDLIASSYTVTYEEESGSTQCENDVTSTGTISFTDENIALATCSSASTYYQPFTVTLNCIATYRGNTVGSVTDTSDILILGAEFDGVWRFYCARYRVEYAALVMDFSLDARDQSNTHCDVQEHIATYALLVNVTDSNAGFKAIHFNSEHCDLDPCLNGGTCTQYIGRYICACATGYTGTHCEIDIDDCAAEPCLNGGTCVDGLNSYTCTCAAGYIGDTCETAVCSFDSGPGGVWAQGYNNAYTELNELAFSGYYLTLPSSAAYVCMEQVQAGNAIYTSLSSSPTDGSQLCVEYRLISHYLLYRAADPVSQAAVIAGSDCQANVEGLGAPLQLALPVEADNVQLTPESCPFAEAEYHATISEAGSVDQCAGTVSSGEVDGTSLDLNTCFSGNSSFSQPFVTMLQCAGTIPASSVDPSGAVGDDIVVLAYLDPAENYYSFYCARYRQEGIGYIISLPITDQYAAACTTSASAELVDAQHSQITLHSNLCSSSPCQNSGTCTDLFLDFQCTCAAGYTGSVCETEINECASSPCLNGATCTDHVAYYVCECPLGYGGVHCEAEINECASEPCLNGGTCLDRINGYYCDCVPGWIWQNCEQPDECVSDNDCQNGGACEDDLGFGRCICPDTHSGDFCEVSVFGNPCESNPCENGGRCTDDEEIYVCECTDGFQGDSCAEAVAVVSGVRLGDTSSIVLIVLFTVSMLLASIIILFFALRRMRK